MQETCSVDGCGRSRKTRGLCQTHYVGLWRSGSVGPAELKRHPAGEPCSVEGCTRPSKSRRLCSMHYHRWQRHGDSLGGYVNKGTVDVGYGGAHHRVEKARGKAAGKACATCGGIAEVWAYVGLDGPTRRVDEHGRIYSAEPADYASMCRRCQIAEQIGRWAKGVGCIVRSCDRPHAGQGLCNLHYKRLWRRGDIPPKVAVPGSRGIAYETAHARVKALRGRASAHTCSSCGAPAREWAYLHLGEDLDLVVDERGRTYSLNIARYTPMCAPCHRNYDSLHPA